MNAGALTSIALSVLALLVSGTTLYLTLLRKKAALVGCLLSMTTPEVGDADDWNFEFALANTGDVELLIREVDLDLPTSGTVPEISATALPLVIRPGQVAPLDFGLPNRFCRQVLHSQERVAFNFHIFSSRGSTYVARTLVTLTDGDVVPPKVNWAPFTLGQAVR